MKLKIKLGGVLGNLDLLHAKEKKEEERIQEKDPGKRKKQRKYTCRKRKNCKLIIDKKIF